MRTYICLLRWTPKGMDAIKDSPSRLEAARKVFQSAGGSIKDFYMTMGQYDMVIVAEAPDDAALAKALLTIGSKGAVQTETLRAFSDAEYRSIISGL